LQAGAVTSATRRQLLRQLLSEGDADRPLVDIGSSTVSGLRHPHPFAGRGNPGHTVAHPVQHLQVLDSGQARAVGSDTVRAGWTFFAPALDSAGSFTDAAGVRWVWSDGEPTALAHPLELAGVRGIRRHPRPGWPTAAAVGLTGTTEAPAGGDGQVVVAEPPCPGLLELAMAMRNPWQFMHDITDGWRVAGALLDWSLETLLDAYTRTLAALPRPPDLVVHPDVLGFRAGMYLSVHDFRTQYQPRLQILLDRLRELTGAPVLLQCRGAVGPVLTDLALLEPELLHLERDAAGVDLCRLRAALPARTGLHGVVDLVRLGRALTAGDHAFAAREAVSLSHAWPAVAAPLRIVTADVPGELLARAASFVRSLTPATLRALRGEPEPARVLAPLFCRTGARPDAAVGTDVAIELDGDQEPALTLPCLPPSLPR
jgi:hypothetical protein